jgi:hypothetical protein
VLELLELRRRVEQIDVVLEHLQELPKQTHMRISEQTSKQTLDGTESRTKGGEEPRSDHSTILDERRSWGRRCRGDARARGGGGEGRGLGLEEVLGRRGPW